MKTRVRTNLLGFLLTIPITTSFIEGRIPPFISPLYSPCETIEMREQISVTQNEAYRKTEDSLVMEAITAVCGALQPLAPIRTIA